MCWTWNSLKKCAKCLSVGQKHDRVVASWQFLSTLDRTQQVSWFDLWQWMKWIHLYDPETQEQSKEWRNSASPHQKSFKNLKTACKVTASVFWNKGRILLVYYLKKSTTVTESSSVLDKVKQVLVPKWWRNLSKWVLFVPDTTSRHTLAIRQQKLADLHFEVLKHPACSADLAIYDYHLSPNLKKHLKWMQFSSTEDVISVVDDCSAAQPSEFYLDGLKKLEQWVSIELR